MLKVEEDRVSLTKWTSVTPLANTNAVVAVVSPIALHSSPTFEYPNFLSLRSPVEPRLIWPTYRTEEELSPQAQSI